MKKSREKKQSSGARRGALARSGDLAIVTSRLIDPNGLAAWNGQVPIARIVSGAVEIAKQRGYIFYTHREIAEKLGDGVLMLAYSMSLAIIAATGPKRTMSLAATLIQAVGAAVVLRELNTRPIEANIVEDARGVLKLVLEL